MYKIYTKHWCVPPGRIPKLLLIMKLTVILVMATLLQVSASTYAQKLTYSKSGATLSEVFNQIHAQTGYNILYSPDLINEHVKVNVSYNNADLKKVLDQLIDKELYSYTIDNKNILITKAKEKSIFQKLSDAFATTTLLGKITDENGQPLPGATIAVKGTRNAVVADPSGAFSITVNTDKDILVITFIGYETKELPAKNLKTPLIISLRPSASNLDQVQITAFGGTTTRRYDAGNVITVTAKDIEKNPVNNVLEALQGNVPGLFIQQATGQPGGSFQVRLRGATNLSVGNTQPLVVVDGVRYPSGTLPLSTNTQYATQNFLQGGSGLNYINPNDIESISILKDVDATALYGSSGAYGVILITTKKAKSTESTFNVNIYTGISVLGKVRQLMNTDQYVMLRREALTNDGTKPTAADLDINGTWPTDRYNNWQKEFMGNAAATTNANLSYSGGARNTTFLINGSYRNIGNIQRHSGTSTDGSVRMSLNTSTNDNKLDLAVSTSYMSSKSTMVPYDFSGTSLLSPNAPSPYNADGSLNWAAIGTDVNSTAGAGNINRLYDNTTGNLLANATLVYKPTKKLTFRTILGFNDLTGKEQIGYPTTTLNPADKTAPTKTASIFHHYNTRAITIAPYAEYNTGLIGNKDRLSIKVGSEIDNTKTYYDDITGTGFPSDALLGDPAAGATISTDYNLTAYRSIGFYGIIKYIWDNKYILDINARRDGSTKFGANNRFGNFGSVAGAWIFSEEKLIKNNLPFISYGKLRASTGTVGGDAIGDFNYLSIYKVISGTYDTKVGLTPDALANPNLKWEVNRNSDFAIELGFLKDRILLDVDYYINKASNQLVSIPLSTVTGYSGYAINTDAVIRTSGWEFNFTSTNIKTKNFNWMTKLNVSFPQSKLLKVPSLSDASTNYILGKPTTGIKLYNYQGVNPATGYYSFTNAAGVTNDYTSGLTQADKNQFIDLAPKFYGGFTNTFTYKQLTLDFTVTFTDRMAKNFLGQTGFSFGPELNGSTDWLRRWQKPGDITDIPRVSNLITNFYSRQLLLINSTGGYSSARYARLQNLNMRYNFKQALAHKIGLKGLSVYLQGQNLLTVSKYGGLDPENLSAGVIPPLRTFTAGFNVTL